MTTSTITQFPVLFLNADFSPMSVFPLSTRTWHDAVKDIFNKKVYVVGEYDERIPTSNPKNSILFPSVVVSKSYVRKNIHHVAFNRENIWIRDMGKCAYCPADVSFRDLTFDHVYPRSLGGPADWLNIVCACQSCNTRKADKTTKQAKMWPRVKPYVPNPFEMSKKEHAMKKLAPPKKDWIDFLYWGLELDPH